MSRDPITIQRGRELVEQLAEHGWQIRAIEAADLDWWADEMWVLESVWSPVGERAYLTFLVDPQDTMLVWAIAASRQRPQSRPDAQQGPLIRVRHVWKQELPAFLQALARLRAESPMLS
ncbi:MAG: hypothetical protein M3R24_33030 [Chloroflexota bacterium]|nr:hypothetical protein [Chloroflexota bacterium]